MEDLLQVGVITTTHGVRGEVKVFPTTDDPARFKKLKNVVLDTGKELVDLEVAGVKFFKNMVIVKFKGIDNINDVEKYRKKSLYVTRENAVKLKKNEYFIADLIGLQAESDEGSSFVMADIPGLIEGAWQGTGLGHQFLRHVERCRMLVHIVDVSGSEGRDPKEDFITINNELAKFNPELAERPMVVAGNKCDMATDEQIADFKKFVEDQGYDFFPIMAAIRYDVDPLLKKIQEMLSKLPPITHYEAEPAPIVTVDDFDDHSVIIKNVNGIYTVEADWLLQVMKGINFDDYESLNYFQKVLINGGVIDALRKKGCSDGDTVSIYELEFDFMD